MFKKFAILNSPQSWYFVDPDTKMKITGTSLQDVAKKVIMYRAQNELPALEYLEAVIENYLCGRPENRGSCEDMPKLKRGLIPSIKGGIVILQNIMYNSFASQEVADRRSEACKDCPHNVFPDKGPFIKWADNIAEHSVGDRRSKHHSELGNCNICSCPLRAKVFFTGELGLKAEQLEAMPAFCWQKKEALKNDPAS